MLHTIAMTIGEFVVTYATVTGPVLALALIVAVGLIGKGLGWLED